MVQQPPVRPGPPHFRDFTITLRHTTLGRNPLKGRSAWLRDRYLTTNTIHKRQTSMPPVDTKSANPRLRPRGHWHGNQSGRYNNIGHSQLT